MEELWPRKDVLPNEGVSRPRKFRDLLVTQDKPVKFNTSKRRMYVEELAESKDKQEFCKNVLMFVRPLKAITHLESKIKGGKGGGCQH